MKLVKCIQGVALCSFLALSCTLQAQHQPDSVVISASKQYKTDSKFKIKMFGQNYRNEWQQKIKVKVIHIDEEHGGLTIVKKGGGMQTKSLRLEAKDGKQYVLRTIEKYAEGAVPQMLRNTFAQDIVQDQISASHPYGAFVLPFLADAAGIYHTNPQLVYIPDDANLLEYRAQFANTLALYEQRPAHDWSDADYFGNSEKIISTAKVLEKLAEDNDDEVDEKFVVRSRLFDMLIGDWDRHDDQWRWASFEKKGKGKLYRPIPRDRDQVFFINEGFFPSVASRKWALPKLEGFNYDIRWTSGFMFNARYFDRSFLTSLSKKDWIKEAEYLQEHLTDSVIEAAIHQWPDAIFQWHGEEIIARLKSRRDNLQKYAEEHYLFLARQVDVVGSDKHEYFEVERMPDNDVKVTVRKMKKDGELKKKIYKRTFHNDETEEIRLYGRGGNDEFHITGESTKGPKIRIIGGADEDVFVDSSKVVGWSKKNIFYDTRDSTTLQVSGESRLKLKNDNSVNTYNRKSFKYNVLMPLVTGNYNVDDGLFVGGGFLYTDHGFRKEPFRNRHMFLASYALRTSSFNFKYKGDYTDVVGTWDLSAAVDFKRPNFVNNFFGMGNESVYDKGVEDEFDLRRPISYYRLRFEEISTDIGLSQNLSKNTKITISHIFQSFEIEADNDKRRFIYDYDELTDKALVGVYRNYMGGRVNLLVDKRDNEMLPLKGIYWNTDLSVWNGIHNSDYTYSTINTSFSWYASTKAAHPLTLAVRVGGGANFGDYEFYQSQVLDGKTELRGFRKTRFYGDQKVFSNVELRWELFAFRTYIFPGSFGVLAFNDAGRVWYENENSDKWHQTFGGGIWVAPFNRAVVSAEVGHSPEDTLVYARLGYLF
ncbi:outer membrane protein assembly factor [Fulvivirga maritima]|uniref:BamA/TamA family outer membrane protein n=1 Tax=Fulvivirga maritima TaxID=2904247 RepID=UPI001F3294E8|nr:BamA/TamA family outer membrane protein [Fulvivirga maritima]UII27902.1 outer membrane protein assembly factor [Fulvivirga maritima]